MKMRESWNPVPKGSTSSPTKRNFRIQKMSESGLHKWFLKGSNRTEYRGETILPRSPLWVFDFHRFPGKKRLVATPPFERMSTCHARKEQAGRLISQRTKNLQFPSCWSRYGNRSYPNRALPVDRRTRVKPDNSSLSKYDNGKSQSTVIRSIVNRRLLCVSRIEHTIECSNYTLLASGLWSIQGQSCNQRLSQIFR